MLSADDTFKEVGSSTGIHYLDDREEYLTTPETGLWQKKTNIIRQWDEKIFPVESSSMRKAMDLLLADSEDEDDQMEDQGGYERTC